MSIAVRPVKRSRKVVRPVAGTRYDYVSPARGKRLLDRQARRYLRMSGAEFTAKYRAGELPDPDRPEVIRVAMLIPFTGE